MENIEIWTLDGAKATPLGSISEVESEEILEDRLVDNPALLMDGLTLVGRQLWTEGGYLDLLGVDKNGKLVVFEIKREMLRRTAVAQVIDYASDLERMDWGNLCSLISENSGADGIEKIENFDEWYGLDPQRTNPKPIGMVIVGLGADAQTERMVRFLAEDNGMDISLLTFHGFKLDGKTLLAKQVEVEGSITSERGQTSRYASRSEKWDELYRLADDSGARDLFDSAVNMFRETWSEDWRGESPLLSSLRIDLYETGTPVGERPYVRVEIWDRMWISFHQRAFTLCEDAFERALESVEYRISPSSQEDWKKATFIQFPLTADVWKRHKETLTALSQAVYDAWMESDDEDDTD